MSKISILGVVLLGVLSIAEFGCGSKKPAAAPKTETKSTDGPLLAPPQQQTAPAAPQGDRAALPNDGEPSQTAAEAAQIKANLASLSVADRTLAEQQKICPVSGETLGAMGPPKKITVAGRAVFICCPSCEEPLNNEPARFLAKIAHKPAG
jgi:hypothetical protein